MRTIPTQIRNEGLFPEAWLIPGVSGWHTTPIIACLAARRVRGLYELSLPAMFFMTMRGKISLSAPHVLV